MAVQFYSLGAAQEVTGSKHVFEVDGKCFMVDCGAFQGRRKEADKKNREFNFAADKLEAVILTHAHYDHCALLPVLVKAGLHKPVYATPATRDLASLIMTDSAKIQAHDAEFLKKRAARKGMRFDFPPLFDAEDVLAAVEQMITVSYRRKISIAPNVTLEFFDAGHILGSAFAAITITARDFGGANGDLRVLYTGDIGRPYKPIIKPPAVNVPPPHYIFLESTYGGARHEDSDSALDTLAASVQRAAALKSKIIIPAFAIERTQEIIYSLHLLTDQKKIPEIPIYVDSPMAMNATTIFTLHPECYSQEINQAFTKHYKNPFGFNKLDFITSAEESKKLNGMKGPMIIISADGMCEAGRVVHHLANAVENPDNAVLIVGYMAENTLGRRLKRGDKAVSILGEPRTVRAKIDTINAFSAHADCAECLDWLNAIDTSCLQKIFLVHGEPDSQVAFKTFLSQNGFGNVEIVKYGETYQA